MREEIKDPLRLKHILEACERIQDYVRENSIDDLNDNSLEYYGLIKNLEIIGEAAYKLTNDFRDKHPATDWRSIIAMRHLMVHGYYKIRTQIVKDIIETDIPLLKAQVEIYASEVIDESSGC